MFADYFGCVAVHGVASFGYSFHALLVFVACLLSYFDPVNLPMYFHPFVFYTHYDYIIVGGGSAGCVLANRLSDNSSNTVLLIEAGTTEDVLSQVPLLAPLLIKGPYDWNYRPEPQRNACLSMKDQTCPWPRGRALGGSSAINFMLYVRGNRRDFDNWRDHYGAVGWSYSDVLPHFMAIEESQVPDDDEHYRGTGGEVPVVHASKHTRLSDVFLEACKEIGYPMIDYNGRSQAGCSRVQANICNGERCSASKCFVAPLLPKDNLHIALNSHATKVLFKGDRAVGVHLSRNYLTYEFRALREVIISAGAVGSPQLLMLSGIGPQDHLRELEIPVVADLPVGTNLQDHMHIGGIAGTLHDPVGINIDSISTVMEYKHNRSGPLSIPASIEALAFVNTPFVEKSLEFPDVQIALQSLPPSSPSLACYMSKMDLRKDVYDKYYLPKWEQPGFSLVPVMNRPKSTGYIKLRTNDYLDDPIIQPNYLTHPEDLQVAVEGAKIALRFIDSEAMRKAGAKLWDIPFPACSSERMWSDRYLACLVRHMSQTTWHACCTCPMGNDSRAVVDETLRCERFLFK
ncbi:hypothetical protein HPB50_011969 [Hyalomma asiaticum]|uniref:Uncharacterized protein n=1 Tax=Hyalomma asiaticum TaxID=266040 RepID=A0ACB7T7M0_HYAAI|nr:hypothetical protein HPB50_011969 [Hyalomma asiaticum]